MKPAGPYRVLEYLTEEGKSPFGVWLASLDVSARARVQARIFRFESGNLGDCKSVGEGVFEARINFGPGYRVYFGIERKTGVLLLLGGDKKSQGRDIRDAKRIWSDYSKGRRNGKTN